MNQTQRILELAIDLSALVYGSFTLSSGQQSSYYFDGRRLTLDPEGSFVVSKAVLALLRGTGVEAIGGPTLGADPIVTSVALASHLEGRPVPAFIVRTQTKGHGTQQAIEGSPTEGKRVAIVDDVCTTGGSLFRAIEVAEAVGCTVAKVIVILDRCQGGSEELRRRGYDFVALLEASPEGVIRVCKGGR